MRVSECRDCLTASKGLKVCRPNIYTKQATPVPSGSILEQAKLGQLLLPYDRGGVVVGLGLQKCNPQKSCSPKVGELSQSD